MMFPSPLIKKEIRGVTYNRSPIGLTPQQGQAKRPHPSMIINRGDERRCINRPCHDMQLLVIVGRGNTGWPGLRICDEITERNPAQRVLQPPRAPMRMRQSRDHEPANRPLTNMVDAEESLVETHGAPVRVRRAETTTNLFSAIIVSVAQRVVTPSIRWNMEGQARGCTKEHPSQQ